jgi:hypothetical protein
MKYLYAYYNIALPSNIVTALACYDLWRRPTASTFLYLIWYKLIVLAGLVVFIHLFRSAIVCFFMNLGVGRARLYTSVVGIDLVVFIFSMSLVLLVK